MNRSDSPLLFELWLQEQDRKRRNEETYEHEYPEQDAIGFTHGERQFPARPVFVYSCRSCGDTIESHVRETLIWLPGHDCRSVDNEPVPYKRVIVQPQYKSVWHEHHNLTTGQLVSDEKKFGEQLHVASEEASERLGMEHRFVPVSLKQDVGKTDEGMGATHDRVVAEGRKEAVGKIIH